MTFKPLCLLLWCATVFIHHGAAGQRQDVAASRDSLDAKSIKELNLEAEQLTETDPVRSLRLSEKASRKAGIVQDDAQLALSLRNKAAVFAHMGQMRDAIIAGAKAVSIARTTKDREVLAKTLNTLGFIHMSRQEGKLAQNILTEALALNRSLKADEQAAKNELNLAILDFYFFDKVDQGLAKMNKILGWAEVSQNYQLQNNALTNLAGMANARQKPDEALQYLARALVCNEHTGNKNDLIFNLNQMANLELNLDRVEQAKAHIARAMQAIGPTTLAPAQACTYHTAANIEEAIGKPAQALLLFRRSTHIYDSLKDADRTRLQELANMAVASERQTAENNVLRKDTDLQRQKIGLQRTVIALIGLVLGIVVVMLILVYRSNRKVQHLVQMLQKQNHAIIVQKEKIQTFNDTLEKLVEERTDKLEKRTRQVLEYASYNSHIVRGPLARILGLAYLLQHTDSDTDARLYTVKMEESAREVDEAIKAVSRKLELEEEEYLANLQLTPGSVRAAISPKAATAKNVRSI